jgi:thiosulfate/3-mercaptopyruvate sulfurtransferase
MKTCTVALVVIAFLAIPVLAQTPAPLLVDANWLSQHLTDRNLVLLHVNNKQEYDSEHIPGARFITDADITANTGNSMYDLPAAAELRTKLASFGISDDSHIVLYFGKNGGVPSATRVIFTLDYAGLGDRTSLLNGGLPAWKRAGQQVTTAVPPVTPGKLSTRPTKNVVADAELVKSLAQRAGYKLVDARAASYYTGIEDTHGKSGHIPGAINIPFSNITDTNLMINRERIAELFTAAGIRTRDTVVAYCHIGQQATAVIFAARLLGYPVLLYDGSFHDWAMNNRGPVERTEK